jgi:hypothetical protein
MEVINSNTLSGLARLERWILICRWIHNIIRLFSLDRLGMRIYAQKWIQMQAREVCPLKNSMLPLVRLHELIPVNSHPRVFLKCRMQVIFSTISLLTLSPPLNQSKIGGFGGLQFLEKGDEGIDLGRSWGTKCTVWAMQPPMTVATVHEHEHESAYT